MRASIDYRLSMVLSVKAGDTPEICKSFFYHSKCQNLPFFHPISGQQLNNIAEIFVLEVRASWYRLQAIHGIISESWRHSGHM